MKNPSAIPTYGNIASPILTLEFMLGSAIAKTMKNVKTFNREAANDELLSVAKRVTMT